MVAPKRLAYKKTLYLTLSGLAPIAIASLVILLAMKQYSLALINTLLVVCIMEGRIQTSRRLPRKTLFWIHIASSVLFLLTLLLVMHRTEALWPLFLMWGSLVVQVTTGSVLWYRGVSSVIQKR